MRPDLALAILAGALAATAAAAAGAAELGTLFHTPEERAQLDKRRRGEPEAVVQGPAAPRPPRLTGFVRRSDGRGTVFINGVPVVVAAPAASELLDPAQVRAPGEAEVRIERAKEPAVKR